MDNNIENNIENILEAPKITIPDNATPLISCDVNDSNSRMNYDMTGGTASYINGKYQYQFVDASYDIFASHDCSDEWNTNSIYYPDAYDTYKYKFEYVWDDNEYINVAAMNLYSYDMYCDVDMEIQNSPNINAIQSELRFDYKLPYGTKIEIYQNDEWVGETDMEDEYSYNTAFITLYNGVNWGDKFTFRFITRDGSYMDARAYIKNISFEAYIPDSMQMNLRYRPNKLSALVPTKDIKEGRFILDINGYNLTNNSYTSTYIELCPNTTFYSYNTIKIDEIREYPEITLDEMYIRVCAKRTNTLYRGAISDFTLYTYDKPEVPKEEIPVSITLDTNRNPSSPVAILSDTNRCVVPSYYFKLDYDYLIANPNAFNMTRALTNHTDKTFLFDTYSIQQVAHHNMTKASEPNNIEYHFALPYNDDNKEQDISAFTFSSEYDNWSGNYVNYGAISLPELHRVYGMIIVKGLDKSKPHTMNFRIKVATVGDLEYGEADFVKIGTDTIKETPQLINCTNEYVDVTVSISSDDIWEDGTARVHIHYNNFHLGNFVDVEIRLTDIVVESFTGHGLNITFQSAHPVNTKAIKKHGANIDWLVPTQTDKITKTVGFSTTQASNVYPTNVVMFGNIDGKNRSLYIPGKIDYVLEDGYALDSNCPDEAYLTINISRPADLSQVVEFKSLELLGTDKHISKGNISLDTHRETYDNSEVAIVDIDLANPISTVNMRRRTSYIQTNEPIPYNSVDYTKDKIFNNLNCNLLTTTVDESNNKYGYIAQTNNQTITVSKSSGYFEAGDTIYIKAKYQNYTGETSSYRPCIYIQDKRFELTDNIETYQYTFTSAVLTPSIKFYIYNNSSHTAEFLIESISDTLKETEKNVYYYETFNKADTIDAALAGSCTWYRQDNYINTYINNKTDASIHLASDAIDNSVIEITHAVYTSSSTGKALMSIYSKDELIHSETITATTSTTITTKLIPVNYSTDLKVVYTVTDYDGNIFIQMHDVKMHSKDVLYQAVYGPYNLTAASRYASIRMLKNKLSYELPKEANLITSYSHDGNTWYDYNELVWDTVSNLSSMYIKTTITDKPQSSMARINSFSLVRQPKQLLTSKKASDVLELNNCILNENSEIVFNEEKYTIPGCENGLLTTTVSTVGGSKEYVYSTKTLTLSSPTTKALKLGFSLTGTSSTVSSNKGYVRIRLGSKTLGTYYQSDTPQEVFLDIPTGTKEIEIRTYVYRTSYSTSATANFTGLALYSPDKAYKEATAYFGYVDASNIKDNISNDRMICAYVYKSVQDTNNVTVQYSVDDKATWNDFSEEYYDYDNIIGQDKVHIRALLQRDNIFTNPSLSGYAVVLDDLDVFEPLPVETTVKTTRTTVKNVAILTDTEKSAIVNYDIQADTNRDIINRYKIVAKSDLVRRLMARKSFISDLTRSLSTDYSLIADTKRDVLKPKKAKNISMKSGISNDYYINVSSTTSSAGVASFTTKTFTIFLRPKLTNYNIPDEVDYATNKLKLNARLTFDGQVISSNISTSATTFKLTYSIDGATYKDFDFTTGIIELPVSANKVTIRVEGKTTEVTSDGVLKAFVAPDYLNITESESNDTEFVYWGHETQMMLDTTDKTSIDGMSCFIYKYNLKDLPNKFTLCPVAYKAMNLYIVTTAKDGTTTYHKKPSELFFDKDVLEPTISVYVPVKGNYKGLYAKRLKNSVDITLDTNRRVHTGSKVNIVLDTNRKSATSDLKVSDTARYTHRSLINLSDTKKEAIKNTTTTTDTKRATTLSSNKVVDTSRSIIFTLAVTLIANTLRKLHKLQLANIDTKRRISSDDSNLNFYDTLRIRHITTSILTDTKKAISRSVATPLDTIKSAIVHHDIQSDLTRKLSKHHSHTLDTTRYNVVSSNSLLDATRYSVVSHILPLDTKKLAIANYDIQKSTKRLVHTSSILNNDSLRFTLANSHVLNNTKRVTMINLSTIKDTRRLVIGSGQYISWLNTRRRVIKATNTLSDTNRKTAITNPDILSDTLRKVIFKTGPITKQIDTKRLTILNTSTSLDLYRFLTHDTHKTYDTYREIYFEVNVVNTYDTYRSLRVEDTLIANTNRFLVEKATNVLDTYRRSYSKIDNKIDTTRAAIVYHDIQIDTDRLPFIFVNSLYEAKRDSVYLVPVYRYDTTRDLYVLDMTKVYADTLRAITKDIDVAPVVFNISITDTLFFNIKL